MQSRLALMNTRLIELGLIGDLDYVHKGFKLDIGKKSLNAKTLNVNAWVFRHKNMTPSFDPDSSFISHDGIRLLLDIEAAKDTLEQHIREGDVDTCPLSKSMVISSFTENMSDRIPLIMTCEPAFTNDYIRSGCLDAVLRSETQKPFVIMNAYPSDFTRHSILVTSCSEKHSPENKLKTKAPMPRAVYDIINASGEYAAKYDVLEDMKKLSNFMHASYDVPDANAYIHAIPVDWACCLFSTWDMNMDIKHVLFLGNDEYEALYLKERETKHRLGENRIVLKKHDRDTNSFLYKTA